MTSEATKMAVRSNMHLDDMVIEVTEFNSEVRADLRGHYHCCTLVFRAIALLFVGVPISCKDTTHIDILLNFQELQCSRPKHFSLVQSTIGHAGS